MFSSEGSPSTQRGTGLVGHCVGAGPSGQQLWQMGLGVQEKRILR